MKNEEFICKVKSEEFNCLYVAHEFFVLRSSLFTQIILNQNKEKEKENESKWSLENGAPAGALGTIGCSHDPRSYLLHGSVRKRRVKSEEWRISSPLFIFITQIG